VKRQETCPNEGISRKVPELTTVVERSDVPTV
jgi:hypothetical protein